MKTKTSKPRCAACERVRPLNEDGLCAACLKVFEAAVEPALRNATTPPMKTYLARLDYSDDKLVVVARNSRAAQYRARRYWSEQEKRSVPFDDVVVEEVVVLTPTKEGK